MIPAKGEEGRPVRPAQPHAIVVFPDAHTAQITDSSLVRWLWRGDVHTPARGAERLQRVLFALGRNLAWQEMGALRLWGQTASRPRDWVAAADPVYLEPMLDHLRLHELRSAELPEGQRDALFAELQQTLCGEGALSFLSIGELGYLRADTGAETTIATASVSAESVDGSRPDRALSQADAASELDRLLSEVQMCLHGSSVNVSRLAAGQRPANSLWLWGGGVAPEARHESLPLLIADDPLFLGYWHACSAASTPWPGSVQACLEDDPGPVVIVLPASRDTARADTAEAFLQELRSHMHAGHIKSLYLVFRDGVDVSLKRRHRYRLWRSPPGHRGQNREICC